MEYVLLHIINYRSTSSVRLATRECQITVV